MMPRMDLLERLNSYLFVSILVGLLTILAALLRRTKTAQVIGILCVLAGIITALGLGYRLFFIKGIVLIAVALTPTVLGGAALAIAHYYKDRPPLKRWFQTSVPAILYATLVVACIAGSMKFSESIHFFNRDLWLAHFQQNRAIDNVVVLGTDSVDTFKVDAVEFSIAGRPDTRIRLELRDEYYHDYKDESWGHVPYPLAIQRIGNRTPGATVEGHWSDNSGNYGTFRDEVIGLHADESDAPLRELIPLELNSIDDVIAHYDDLVETLEKWPPRDQPGSHTNADGTIIQYWTEKDPDYSPQR